MTLPLAIGLVYAVGATFVAARAVGQIRAQPNKYTDRVPPRLRWLPLALGDVLAVLLLAATWPIVPLVILFGRDHCGDSLVLVEIHDRGPGYGRLLHQRLVEHWPTHKFRYWGMHARLRRLERENLLASWEDEENPEARGRRPRRYYGLTDTGIYAVYKLLRARPR